MRHRQTGKICAMKVMRKSAVIKHGYVKHTNKEREILSDMSYHPFIVGSFGSMPCRRRRRRRCRRRCRRCHSFVGH